MYLCIYVIAARRRVAAVMYAYVIDVILNLQTIHLRKSSRVVTKRQLGEHRFYLISTGR